MSAADTSGGICLADCSVDGAADICSVGRFLFIGSLAAAEDHEALRVYGIKRVLTVMNAEDGRFLPYERPCAGVSYTTWAADDLPGENISRYFWRATRLIGDAVAREQSVLVHCRAGMSRSASLVLAYLMMARGMRFRDAYSALYLARPLIHPNAGFRKQLRAIEPVAFLCMFLPERLLAVVHACLGDEEPASEALGLIASSSSESESRSESESDGDS